MPAEITALKDDILGLLSRYHGQGSADGGGRRSATDADVLRLPQGRRGGPRRSRLLPPAGGTVVAMPRPDKAPPAAAPLDPEWSPEMIRSRIRQREQRLRRQREFVESTPVAAKPEPAPPRSRPPRKRVVARPAPRPRPQPAVKSRPRPRPAVKPRPRPRPQPAVKPRPRPQRVRRPKVAAKRPLPRAQKPLLDNDPALVGLVLLVAGVLSL